MNWPFKTHRTFQVLRWTTPHNSGSDPSDPRPIDNTSDLQETDDLGLADIVTSQHKDEFGLTGRHMIMLDIDAPAALIPSSTPGHYHLYIERYMGWDAYVRILDAMANGNVLERGYVEASKKRGFTALRLPWVRKGLPS